MPSKSESWGIEVGAQAVKAVHLARSGGGVELVDFEVIPYKQVLTSPDTDPEQQIQAALEQLTSKHDLSRASTVVSVPGHMGFARFASLPPVDAKKLPDIVKYEAAQQIPFPIEEVEWDYKVFREEDNPEVKAGIFAITKEQVLTYLNNFRRLDIRVDELTLSSLGVYNALNFDDPVGEDEGAIYVDISTRSTDLIFVEGQSVWIRTLPIGGNAFTEAIARAFQISFTKAEQLKKEAATSKYARQISQAIRSDLANLQQEIQRSIGYYQSLNRDANITKIVGLGSTFRLPGLRTFLQKNLELEVIKPDGFKQLSMDGPRSGELSDATINLVTAYGLAMQGLGVSAIDCNILPRFILTQRLWKSKQPWFAGAAACLAAAAGLVAVSHIKDNASFSGGASSKQNTKRVISEAENYRQELSTVLSEDRKPLIENYLRLLDYRDLYVKLYQDVVDAAASPAQGSPSAAVNGSGRFYVEWLDIAYQPDAAANSNNAADASARSTNAAGNLSAFAQTKTLAAFFVEGDSASSLGDGDTENSDTDAKDRAKGPRLVVTVSLAAPMAQADRLISSGFVQWLQDNADRPDRPYRIVVDSAGAVRFRDTLRNAPDREAANSRTARRLAPVTTQMGPPAGFDEFDEFGMGGMPGGGSRSGSTVRSGALSELLPERPDATDPTKMNPTSRRFIVQWEVELKPPSQARASSLIRPTAQPQALQSVSPNDLTSNDVLTMAADRPQRLEDPS